MEQFKHIAAAFACPGTYLGESAYGSGHINDTYRACYEVKGHEVHYIRQRVNHYIFKDVPGLMENIGHVTRHQRRKLEAAGAAGSIPERVTHNDTKLNNVLIDNATGKGQCVIDLDTVMPGSVLYDFGDLVRTTTTTVAEDERDLSRAEMDIDYFEALVKGYLESASGFLTPQEKELLAFSSRLITFEIGLRFLTDYPEGRPFGILCRKSGLTPTRRFVEVGLGQWLSQAIGYEVRIA